MHSIGQTLDSAGKENPKPLKSLALRNGGSFQKRRPDRRLAVVVDPKNVTLAVAAEVVGAGEMPTIGDSAVRILQQGFGLSDSTVALDAIGAIGGRLTSSIEIGIPASFRRFWAVAARRNSSRVPNGPLSLSRSRCRMCLRCENSNLIVIRPALHAE